MGAWSSWSLGCISGGVWVLEMMKAAPVFLFSSACIVGCCPMERPTLASSFPAVAGTPVQRSSIDVGIPVATLNRSIQMARPSAGLPRRRRRRLSTAATRIDCRALPSLLTNDPYYNRNPSLVIATEDRFAVTVDGGRDGARWLCARAEHSGSEQTLPNIL